MSSETFAAFVSFLGRKQTEPDAANLLAIRPKISELTQVARTLEVQASNGAVHGDLVPANVFENPFVGRGRTPLVVFRLQAIDGHNDVQARNVSPRNRDLANGAGNELYFDLHVGQLREQDSEFVVTNQRFSAYDRHV
jgi:hypothetical protein